MQSYDRTSAHVNKPFNLLYVFRGKHCEGKLDDQR